MKRSRLKKESKQPISKLQRELWVQCRRIIRKIYPPTCYTCGKTNLVGSNLHTGHLWPKASLGAYLKYDLRVLRPQCYNCNINLGGNGAEFYRLMEEREGAGYLKQLLADKRVEVRAYEHYEKTVEEYKKL